MENLLVMNVYYETMTTEKIMENAMFTVESNLIEGLLNLKYENPVTEGDWSL